MSDWTAIEEEFLTVGTVRGGMLFLRPAEAIALVHRAREAGRAVLGIEGFWITEKATQPSMEHILNLSKATREESWAEAERFLSMYAESGMMFEVVVEKA